MIFLCNIHFLETIFGNKNNEVTQDKRIESFKTIRHFLKEKEVLYRTLLIFLKGNFGTFVRTYRPVS